MREIKHTPRVLQEARLGEGRARVYYTRRPEMETAEEKLSFLGNTALRNIAFEEAQPDKVGNWINLTHNDFDSLIPLASKATKAAKTPAQERAIFKLFSLGVVTNPDEWVYDVDDAHLSAKVRFLIDTYNDQLAKPDSADLGTLIKWTRALKTIFVRGQSLSFDPAHIRESLYRPFTSRRLYFDKNLNEFQYQTPQIWPRRDIRQPTICFTTGGRLEFTSFATDTVPSLTVLSLDANQCLALYRYDEDGNRHDNITDWALKQFNAHYKAAEPSPQPSPAGRGGKMARGRRITKEAIFHYCYGVLHDPVYRETYAQNLKREFPRMPFYRDFWQWAAWGEALMRLHIGFESAAPWPLQRTDRPDTRARAAGQAPKPALKSDPAQGRIVIDSETTLHGIPPEAWDYKLGNRSALDWVLDQHKEKKPKDPTIREHFDTYRIADHKERVIDLLARVVTVSVETQHLVQAMRAAAR
jgi:predicted helicase